MSEYTSFVDGCKKRLVDFYQKECECNFGGTFRGKEYDHILANKDDRMKLIIDEKLQELDTCARLFGGRVRFQACSHHVNSSQIFCINLFGPLMILDDGYKSLNKLLVAIGVKFCGQITCAQFEYSPGDKIDRTQFDFYAETNKGEKAFFEIKYTEGDFGKPRKGSYKNRGKYATMCAESAYLKRMAEMAKEDDICHKFYSHFQVWRVVGRVKDGENDYAVFIFPLANTTLLRHFPQKEVNEMSKVLMIDAKVIIEHAIRTFGTNPALAKHYSKLKEFYFNF